MKKTSWKAGKKHIYIVFNIIFLKQRQLLNFAVEKARLINCYSCINNFVEFIFLAQILLVIIELFLKKITFYHRLVKKIKMYKTRIREQAKLNYCNKCSLCDMITLSKKC